MEKDSQRCTESICGYETISFDEGHQMWSFLNGSQGDLALFECDNNDAYCLLARIDEI